MRGLIIDNAFMSSRSINGWSGPVCDTLYLRHMDEKTFAVSKVGGTPLTFRIDDQPRSVQYYLRERVYGVIRIDLHALTTLLVVPEWSRKAIKRPRVWRWLREQQEDVQEALEAASYARNLHSGGRAYIRLPYMKLQRAAPRLWVLGVMVYD